MRLSPLWQNLVLQLAVTYGFVFGSDDKCQSFEFYSPLVGKYCPGDGVQRQKIAAHECKYICIQSSNCAAFNYNHTTDDCTHFASPCLRALPNLMMEFGSFTPHLGAQQCYEWRPIALRDWDRAVEDNNPTHFVVRLLSDGTYYIGHWSQFAGSCSVAADGRSVNGFNGCDSLWIKEGCTVFSQPYILDQPLPERAVIAGQLFNGDNIYVASIHRWNDPTKVRFPGYYIEANGYAQSRYDRSYHRFNILIVL